MANAALMLNDDWPMSFICFALYRYCEKRAHKLHFFLTGPKKLKNEKNCPKVCNETNKQTNKQTSLNTNAPKHPHKGNSLINQSFRYTLSGSSVKSSNDLCCRFMPKMCFASSHVISRHYRGDKERRPSARPRKDEGLYCIPRSREV